MAYLRQQQDEDEEGLSPAITAGGSGGFFGTGESSPTQDSPANAPTKSGTRFVNLQRYLDQNDVSGTVQKIQNKTNDILNTEGTSYDTAVKPASDFINGSGNTAEHKLKTDHGIGFVSDLAKRWNTFGDNPDAFSPYLNSRSANAPSDPSWSFSPGSQDKVNSLSNIETLAPELASDKSRYTAGMSALDQALYGTDNSTKEAINKIPGTISDWTTARNTDLAKNKESLSKWRSDEDQAAESTRAFLRQLYDEGKAKGTMEWDPTGRTPRKYSNLSKALNLPDDFTYKPIPYDQTPEGKAEKAAFDKQIKDEKQIEDYYRKHPNLTRKLDMIEDAGRNSTDKVGDTQAAGSYHRGSGPYTGGGGDLYGGYGGGNNDVLFGTGNNKTNDWYNGGEKWGVDIGPVHLGGGGPRSTPEYNPKTGTYRYPKQRECGVFGCF